MIYDVFNNNIEWCITFTRSKQWEELIIRAGERNKKEIYRTWCVVYNVMFDRFVLSCNWTCSMGKCFKTGNTFWLKTSVGTINITQLCLINRWKKKALRNSLEMEYALMLVFYFLNLLHFINSHKRNWLYPRDVWKHVIIFAQLSVYLYIIIFKSLSFNLRDVAN